MKCQHLKGQHYSIKQFFPNDLCMMLHNHLWLKDSFKVENKPTNLNVTVQKKNDFFVSTLHPLFKNDHFANFGIVLKKNIPTYLKKAIYTIPTVSNHISL